MRIKDRIRAAYRPGIGYWELMRETFPRDQYPRAFAYSTQGGPPGCAMAFGRAIREMGGWWDSFNDKVWVPTNPAEAEKE